MARWQLLALVAALCVCLGEGLQCYKCSGACSYVNRKNVTCAADQVCGMAKASSGDIPGFTGEMCVNKTLCNTVVNKTKEVLVTINYSLSYTCCDGDFCNSGNTLTFSLLTGMSALVALWLNI